ncbi:hypothetical protein B0E49_06890 [Polaromonas sp. C04]|nr:hypothetical protein B0E49_06890 [Polaromonas sp. C04]
MRRSRLGGRAPVLVRSGTPRLDIPPAALQRLRQSLPRHPGDDRVMADVLAVVPQVRLRVTGWEQADRKAVQPQSVISCRLRKIPIGNWH